MMKNSCGGFVTLRGNDAYTEMGKSVSRRKSYFTTIQSTEFFSGNSVHVAVCTSVSHGPCWL